MAMQQAGQQKDGRERVGWWTRNQRRVTPYIFIAPNMLVFIVFLFGPMVLAIYMSFNQWSLIEAPTFIGLGNYVQMFNDPQFWQSLWNTLLYTVGTVPTSMALGLAVAIGLNRKLPARGLMRSIFFMPVVVSGVAVALVGALLVMYLYQAAFQNLQMGYASAMGVVLFTLLLAFTAFQWWFTRQGEQV